MQTEKIRFEHRHGVGLIIMANMYIYYVAVYVVFLTMSKDNIHTDNIVFMINWLVAYGIVIPFVNIAAFDNIEIEID